MLKKLLTIILLTLCMQSFSQSSLKKIISGPGGTTKLFTALPAAQQLVFNPGKASDFLGLDEKSKLVLIRTEKDQLGYLHHRYFQTYYNIPVENTMYIVHTTNNKAVSLSGSIVTDFTPGLAKQTNSKITTSQAIDAALQFVHADEYMWEDPANENALKLEKNNAAASYYPSVSKVWYNDDEVVNPKDLRLALRVDVYAKLPLSRAYYYIDAATGTVLGKIDILNHIDAVGTANTLYSGNQTIHSDKTGNNAFRLRDYTRGSGVFTLHGDKGKVGTEYISTSNNWNLFQPDQNALDAQWGIAQTYDFYKVNFNRNSIDNNGFALISYANEAGTKDNAFWDGSSMHFGTRSVTDFGVTGIDVTGHELTHGVTQNTCNLIYRGQSGAMNESLSDIMGKSVQFWSKPTDKDWRLSNDMNWFIRDMSNPNAYGQPDTYLGKKWKNSIIDIILDAGGVHKNSGVGNFMFYLLVDGGSGTNDNGDVYSVQGIGLSKANQIIYRSQTVYLTSTSKYVDWREACINAATDLYGASSNAVKQVKNAWFAVGIGTPAAIADPENAKELMSAIGISPNPVSSSTAVVSFTTHNESNIVVKIFDRSGILNQINSLGKRKAGNIVYTMNRLGELKMGEYYLVIEQDGMVTRRTKLIVVH